MRNNRLSWTPFASVDAWRRLQGAFIDAWGGGPVRSPSAVVLQERGITLRRFHSGRSRGPVVLIVPAPIKGTYIWDLQPRVSVVRRLLDSGCRVFLTQWEAPGDGDENLGLADYCDRFMRLSLRAIQHESGKKNPVFLAGHSLGGLFTAVYSALSPADVAGLILIGTPLSFAGRKDAFSPHIAQIPRNRLPIASLGNVAGSVLDMLAASAAPGTFAFARQRDFLASMWSHEALETHLRVQRWSLDERPLAGRLFHETVEWLYGEDRLMSGSLKIGRRCIHPKTVTAPLLVVLERDSEVAPPESMLPFYHATSSSQKQIFWYEGDIGVALQHVGPLVGKSAHAMLWGKITDWIHRNA